MGFFKSKNQNTGHPLPYPEQLIPPQGTAIIIPEQIQDTRRPCWARGRKALFHRWVNSAHPVLPRGQEPDENSRYFQFRNVTALVEFEDGTVGRIYPNELQFADDGGFDKFTWPGESTEEQNGTE